MFDRFIRLARAKKALREQRYLDALQQASDPLIEDDRRAEAIRTAATEQLVGRARKRLTGGDASTALAEAKRLRQLVDGEAVEALVREVDAAVAKGQQARAEVGAARAEFGRLVDRGDLAAAERLIATVTADADERRRMSAHLDARRKEAKARLEGAARDAESGEVQAAVDGYAAALAIDAGLSEAARASVLRRLAEAVAADLEQPVAVRKADAAQLAAAVAAYSRWVSRLPALKQQRAMVTSAQRLVEAVELQLQKPPSLDALARLAERVAASQLDVHDACDRVLTPLSALADVGETTTAAVPAFAQLREAAEAGGYGRLAKLARARVQDASDGEQQLAAARELLERGELDAARAMFVAFLEHEPLHEGVQKELELLDQSMADLDRRLADARMTLRAGRLREACTAAMALVGTQRIANEAQQLLGEARNRMALVDKGLDEVRVSLHGRAAATLEGVRHCLKRLEELQKVQVDHPELPQVIDAVKAEIEALERCDKAAAALARGELDVVVKALPTLIEARGRLLGVERIDARLCELGDGLVRHGDRALDEGRLAVAQRCAGALAPLESVRDDFGARAGDWRKKQEQRVARSAALLAEARDRLAERDLADAERLVEEARAQWRESAEAQAFAHRLHKLRKQTHTLEQVAALADEEDYVGAQQKLQAMPEVPSLLRTRVYDMKQDLARKQGLEGAFLLRVDEGGEHLVMRGESVSFGNVQKARADLPVLANLAGRHASIRRSMSFHGGMQDKVVAEDGEVRVGGRKVDKHVLQSGDRVQLGPALGLVYQRPTSRSLSSRLHLQSGFQVAGTDRVVLMKDRGRDGRILIGPGRDVHVTVAKATGEVELYATNNGQIRVFCEQGGAIDGTVFKGEHPVDAGQVVEAAGITFLLLPWRPAP